jgi:hypothetical protein
MNGKKDDTMDKKETQRPVHEVTLPFNGSILKAAIWGHQEGEKHPRFTVSVCRGYRAKDSEKWEFGTTFSRDETLGLLCVLTAAHDWIVNQSQKEGAEK